MNAGVVIPRAHGRDVAAKLPFDPVWTQFYGLDSFVRLTRYNQLRGLGFKVSQKVLLSLLRGLEGGSEDDDVSNVGKKEAVAASVVRKEIGDYVKVKSLQSPANRKYVVLDEVLQSTTNSPRDVKVISWDLFVSNIFEQMGHSFKVGLSSGEMQLTKGKLQPIDIQVGTRSGNKKLSLVNNLESFGINLNECQHHHQQSAFSKECPTTDPRQPSYLRWKNTYGKISDPQEISLWFRKCSKEEKVERMRAVSYNTQH